MHELASMAANKAQEKSLPPPPAEFITPNANNEKVNCFSSILYHEIQ